MNWYSPRYLSPLPTSPAVIMPGELGFTLHFPRKRVQIPCDIPMSHPIHSKVLFVRFIKTESLKITNRNPALIINLFVVVTNDFALKH